MFSILSGEGRFGAPLSRGAPRRLPLHQIDQSAGHVIASDAQASVAAIDQAVLSYSRLCASIIEVSQSANLPVATGQSALAKMSAGLASLVEGREHIAAATRELLKVQRASTLEPVSFGCPNGLPQPGSCLDERAAARSR